MTDQTPPAEGENALTAEAKAAIEAAATADEETAAKAEAERQAKAKAEADEAAQAAGFADAETKAAIETQAAKPKAKRASRKRQDGGFLVKKPTQAQYDMLIGMAAIGACAQLVLTDGRKPIDGLKPAMVPMFLRRGRPSNNAAVAFAGVSLSSPVTVTHVFALEEGDKPTAAPLAIAELAAPMVLREGEQFKIGVGGIVFFPPAAQS